MSHVPIHPYSLDRWIGNVHGHLHENVIEKSPHHPDTKYMNVCVEHTNYTPIPFEEVRKYYEDTNI
jgi:calcineurin-like phosphoesterase family protein